MGNISNMSCGHPRGCIVSDKDGTSYCYCCEHSEVRKGNGSDVRIFSGTVPFEVTVGDPLRDPTPEEVERFIRAEFGVCAKIAKRKAIVEAALRAFLEGRRRG